ARNCKPEPHPLRRLLMRRALAASRRVVCNSREMERYAVAHYGAPPSRTRVVYNGVDVDRFARPREAHDGVRIATVGRIERQKNLDVFLSAAEGFLRAYPHARFSVVGDGSLRDHYLEEVRRRDLAASVTLPGTIADVPALLAGLDQFWLTSDYEGTPNVVLEAMAAALPVVATRVGGTGEVVEDGRTGLLVGAGDANAVASAALRLAADGAAAATMGIAAREAVRERFSLEAMITATRAVYAEALGGDVARRTEAAGAGDRVADGARVGAGGPRR
ncbi:MAG: glycosyltransferase, partial [Deltaproteobacteria bacterium]|nr:glycosyltransferase [Deltaproteobacteria bacterium]